MELGENLHFEISGENPAPYLRETFKLQLNYTNGFGSVIWPRELVISRLSGWFESHLYHFLPFLCHLEALHFPSRGTFCYFVNVMMLDGETIDLTHKIGVETPPRPPMLQGLEILKLTVSNYEGHSDPGRRFDHIFRFLRWRRDWGFPKLKLNIWDAECSTRIEPEVQRQLRDEISYLIQCMNMSARPE